MLKTTTAKPYFKKGDYIEYFRSKEDLVSRSNRVVGYVLQQIGQKVELIVWPNKKNPNVQKNITTDLSHILAYSRKNEK